MVVKQQLACIVQRNSLGHATAACMRSPKKVHMIMGQQLVCKVQRNSHGHGTAACMHTPKELTRSWDSSLYT